MYQLLRSKFQTARNLIAYHRAQLSRPAANRSVAELANIGFGNSEGVILCEALWDHPHHWLRLAMLRAAMAPIYGSNLVGIYEDSTGTKTRASLRALKLAGEEVVPDVVPESCHARAQDMLEGIETPAQLLQMEFPSGYLTHFFYDSYLKAERIGQADCGDPKLALHLAQALHYHAVYDRIMSRHDVNALIVSHPTTTRFSMLVWAALCRQIPVFVLNYMNGHITIRRLDKSEHLLSMSHDYPTVSDRDSLGPDQRRILADLGMAYLQSMRQGKQGQIKLVRVYGDGSRRFSSRAEFANSIGADPNKPNVVIMTNCWPDFPNTHGPSYFTDYVDWFRMTLSAISGNRKYNWIVKPHPAESRYGKRVSLKGLVGDRLPNCVYYWPDGATGVDVGEFADCVVSAAGTAGIEYPAIGARALIARETPFTSWGFVNYASSAAEFREKLNRAAELPLPNERQQEDALIYVALHLADPPDADLHLRLPYGLLSYRLWPGIPGFIENNRAALTREIGLMEQWLRSGTRAYNVYKMLNLTSEPREAGHSGSVAAAS